jgi:magnesium transporter
MVTILKSNEQGLSLLTEPINNCWINVVDPTGQEIAWLQQQGLYPDYITYPLDLDERARTERENGELLIVLRVPWYQGEASDIPYTTIPLGIILTDKFIVTICRRQNDILEEFASGRVKHLSTGKKQRFILRLLLATANRYLAYLREINKQVDQLEDQLQLSTRNREVLALLKYQKSLTYFTTALKTNELMMERLQRSQMFKAYEEDEDLLEDVITENQQAIEMTNISSNILSNLMDAFASVISNNLNSVMKFLASITIILSLPTMIASFYGMNVNLPLERHTLAFPMILAVSLLLSIAVAFLFSRRDWL